MSDNEREQESKISYVIYKGARAIVVSKEEWEKSWEDWWVRGNLGED